MLTPETIDRLQATASDFKIVHDDPSKVFVALNGKIAEVAKFTPKRDHVFQTLDGLIAYLASAHCAKDDGILFVGDDLIHADLQYQQRGTHRAKLPLVKSEEYKALERLMAGVPQKELWRLLLSKLDGCLPLELMLQASNIQIKGEYVSDTKIERTGLGNSNTAQVTRITYTAPDGKGTKTSDIGTNWAFMGRIWEAYDEQFEIPLTLEIKTEDVKEPLFIFHPRRLDKVLREAKLALVGELNERIVGAFTVHEGTY
jgi:hypothetical protein